MAHPMLLIDDYRRQLWKKEETIKRLEYLLDQRDQYIEQLKSELDKYQSVFFKQNPTTTSRHNSMSSRRDSSPRHNSLSCASSAAKGPRVKRILGISAEPGIHVEEDWIPETYPKTEKKIGWSMATLREFQIALQDKLEELRLRDEYIEDLEYEIVEKETEIDSLRTELGKYRTLVMSQDANSNNLNNKSGLVVTQRPIVMSPQTSSPSLGPLKGGATLVHNKSLDSGTCISPINDGGEIISRDLIKCSIIANDFMRNLNLQQTNEIVECMYPVDVNANCLIIREGDVGSLVYILEEGRTEVTKEGKYLCTLSPGKVFGELAILYNCTRTASVRALEQCRLWAINRQTYQAIMMKGGQTKHNEYFMFLKSIPMFKDLREQQIHRIADMLEEETFETNEYIVRQGCQGDTFYIISRGQVRITQSLPTDPLETKAKERTLRSLAVGDYFGEQALKGEDLRTANVIAASADGVTCLTLDRDSFIELLSGLAEIERKHYDQDLYTQQKITQEFSHIHLSDLRVLGTLGVGGFGRVELVQVLGDSSRSYALKVMKKHHIIETRQQQHIINERNIMMESNSDFVVKMYRTFKDKKYLYMILEACLGGEVWTILRDRGSFDDTTARFYAACGLEAIEYLHQRGVIYRDLKPENMLLDNRGFAKLVDFGFAKKIGFGKKTWTFCGTPEYVAPEVILNKGHDYSVDFWSMGVLIYELLTGTPPFTAPDPMRTYNMILRGIDKLEFPRKMSKNGIVLIKKLCREVPSDRLGCGRSTIKDIRKHRWFDGFDFDTLRNRSMCPPIVPFVRGPADSSNFDEYPADESDPPVDELTGWDKDF